MGYLLGRKAGPSQVITSNLDTEFKDAIAGDYAAGDEAAITRVPTVLPMRSNHFNRMGAMQKTGQDIARTAPLFYDPRYTHTTLAIPSDLRTLHGLYRYFEDTDPLVGNAIRLHVEFPLAKMNLTDCGIPGVQNHFDEMWEERIFGKQLLFDIGLEYWRIGNAFPFGAWNDTDFMWERFAILNPDYVQVESTWISDRPLIKLQPDEHLKRLVTTGQPRYLYEQLPPEIIRYVRLNQTIPLDPNNIFHISHNKAPYEILGKSIIKRILKLLMYEARIQEAQFAIATRHIIPITVVKVGDASMGYVPDEAELEAIRDLFAAHELDPNFSIFWHWGLNVDYYGASGKILPTHQEFERIHKLKLIGLNTNEVLVTGESANYATAYAVTQNTKQKYLHFLLRMEDFVHRGIFKPVAAVCGFYVDRKIMTSSHGYSGPKFGSPNPNNILSFGEAFNDLRDEQDNIEFQRYAAHMMQKQALKEVTREYIYPKIDLDIDALSGDNRTWEYALKLKAQFPWLVSERRLAKFIRLDPEDEKRQVWVERLEALERRKEEQRLGLPALQPPPAKGAPGIGGGGAPISAPPGGPGAKKIPGQPPPAEGGPPAAAPKGAPPGEAVERKTRQTSRRKTARIPTQLLDRFEGEISKGNDDENKYGEATTERLFRTRELPFSSKSGRK